MVVLEDSESSLVTRPSVRMSKRGDDESQPDDDDGNGLVMGDNDRTIKNEGAKGLAFFHRWEIGLGKQVGEGYFSKVYEVTSVQLSQREEHDDDDEARFRLELHQMLTRPDTDGQQASRYVMKQLHPRLLKAGRQSLENAALDLVAEANFLRQLDHPHIVPLKALSHGIPFQGGRLDSYFIILERLSETLACRIQKWKRRRRKPPPPHQHQLHYQCDYGLQIARALEYLHGQRIIFRDLKPTNIGFRMEDPHHLLMFDFGLARRLPTTTKGMVDDTFEMSGGVGTRRYAAPEICLNKPYNTKADVYSWSMVFLELLTLDKPFAQFNREDHEKFVCEMGGTPSLQHYQLHPRIQGLLRNGWARSITRRRTMAQVCEELESFIQEELQQEEEAAKTAFERSTRAASADCLPQILQHPRSQEARDRRDALVDFEEDRGASLGLLSASA